MDLNSARNLNSFKEGIKQAGGRSMILFSFPFVPEIMQEEQRMSFKRNNDVFLNNPQGSEILHL
jgi:hypothetical protein